MKKILLVDDKNAISKIIVQFLSRSFLVDTKSDGLDALAYLQAGNLPDLILTDLQMPRMDGTELIQKIRGSGYFKDIPIIVLSSRDSSIDRINCLKLGADDYITKPFNPEELMVRIERIFDRQIV